jgi:ribonuclease I
LCFNNFQKSSVFNHSGIQMFRKDIVFRLARWRLHSAFSPHRRASKATQYGDFDRYVLALSWQTGFCQSMVERNRNEPDECRLQKESKTKTDFLTVHGLWPGLPKSIAARGVDERRWMRLAAPRAQFPTCRK